MIINTKKTGGITPAGNIDITDTNVTDVTNYATAQVVDADLIAANIKKDIHILGVVGSYEGGGGGSNTVTGTWTPASDVATFTHNFNKDKYAFLMYPTGNYAEALPDASSSTRYAIATSGVFVDGVVSLTSPMGSFDFEANATSRIVRYRGNAGFEYFTSPGVTTQTSIGLFSSHYFRAGVSYHYELWELE